ncbi:hypothetical protein Agub_g12203 [Astrephomene gubernaculifera]|uniref:Thioesterase domain-containing protein n=1 Tax=Astrephomene gubernaculifera TaxID=47775 RepID=A0AAD3HRB1_9CHLO|nr:hypothetical protein Agub_g12203 [Astrephomene gubernaculifera]
MTSLMEVVDIPNTAAESLRAPPLLSDVTFASAVSAAFKALPGILAESILAKTLASRLYALQSVPPLARVEWLRELEQQEGNTLVLDRKGLTARGGLLPDDHLFKTMARKGLIRDNHVIWAPSYPTLPPPAASRAAAPTSVAPSSSTSNAPTTAPTVFNVYALGNAVCGHPGIVHGGLSSAIIDESFGYLMYLMASAAAEAGAPAAAEASPVTAGPTTAPAPAAAAGTAPAAQVGDPSAGSQGVPETAAAGAAAALVGASEAVPASCTVEKRKEEGQGQQQQAQRRRGLACVGGLSGRELRSAMTARLEVDFVRPLPHDSIVVCVVQLHRVDGRKVWLRAQLMNSAPRTATAITTFSNSSATPASAAGGGGSNSAGSSSPDAAGAEVYARGEALFVAPRPKAAAAAAAAAAGAGVTGSSPST